jgi:hypothetical protein
MTEKGHVELRDDTFGVSRLAETTGRKRRFDERICSVCRKPFVPASGHHTICSDTCRAARAKKRRKALTKKQLRDKMKNKCENRDSKQRTVTVTSPQKQNSLHIEKEKKSKQSKWALSVCPFKTMRLEGDRMPDPAWGF